MTTFKGFPELTIAPIDPELPDDSAIKVELRNGEPFMLIMGQRSLDDVQRLVECWNVCRRLHNPAAHIETNEERVTKLEQLRKEAWARAVEPGANDFRGSESPADRENVGEATA